jgi:glycosyltransferase involved in cell wall biosynthesis
VDPAWFEARPADAPVRTRLGIPDDYVVFVGSAEPRKNLGTLLRAVERVRDVCLVVVGPPGWGDVSEQLHASRAVIVGYQPADVVRSLVAGANALCLPSLYEGFGLPVLEAMAAGTRVLASDDAAIREVAGGHAELIDPLDVDAWAIALTSLVSRPRAGPNEAARAHARTFTWERSAQLHVAAWQGEPVSG